MIFQWRYSIRLENFGEEQVVLREREWEIVDVYGRKEIHKGRGVIGTVWFLIRFWVGWWLEEIGFSLGTSSVSVGAGFPVQQFHVFACTAWTYVVSEICKRGLLDGGDWSGSGMAVLTNHREAGFWYRMDDYSQVWAIHAPPTYSQAAIVYSDWASQNFWTSLLFSGVPTSCKEKMERCSDV